MSSVSRPAVGSEEDLGNGDVAEQAAQTLSVPTTFTLAMPDSFTELRVGANG